MAQKLRALTIAGYKSIRDQTIELRDINILIGANGAGKSNFVSAFRFLQDLAAKRLATHVGRQGGANNLLHFGRKVTQEMKFRLDFDPDGMQLTLAPTVNDALYFVSEHSWFRDRESIFPRVVTLEDRPLEAQLVESESSNLRYSLDIIHNWRVFHFHDTSDAAPCKQTYDVNDNHVLHGDARNLAAFLYRIREQGKQVLAGDGANVPAAVAANPFLASYRQIVAAVKGVAPFFDEFVLDPDPLAPGKIRLAWRERGSDQYFGANALSDGTLRFICLATLLLQPAELLPTTILIDEPELGLHPFAIQQLAAMIRVAATRAQIIVSTQSVTLMNQFAPDDVIVVEREQGERGASTFRRIAPEEVANWADDYALGELWEKNVIGGRPQ